MLESKTWEEAEQKSKIFLRQVMGVDIFDEFINKGKIEIKSNNNIYESENIKFRMDADLWMRRF